MSASAATALSDRFVLVPGTARPCDLDGRAESTRATHAAVIQKEEFLGLVELTDLSPPATRKTFAELARAAAGPIVTERTSLEEVGRLFLTHESHALPVLGRDGGFRGMVTPRSLLAALLAESNGSHGARSIPESDADDLERLALQQASDLRRANRILQAEMSERLKAEAAHRRSANLLHSVVDNVPAIIMRLNLDGTLAFVNQVMPGFTREQMLGRHVTDFVLPDRRDDMSRMLADSIETGRVKNFEAPGTAPHGEPAVYSWRMAPVREGVRMTGLIGIVTDVTDAKQAEAQVQYYNEIVQNIQTGLYVYKVEKIAAGDILRCVSANPAAERLTHVPARDCIGRTLDDVFPQLRQAGVADMILEVMHTATPMEVDDFWYGDGRVPHSAWSFTVFPLANRCVGVAFQNVTERKQAIDALIATEELNRLILKAVPAGIVQVDNTGRIISSNAQAQQFLGFKFDELTGRTIEDFRPETCLEDGSPCPVESYPVTRCLATKLPQPPMTIGVRQRDGSLRWGLFSAMPLPFPERGDCRGAVVTFLDITERKRTEEHARDLQAELAHVARLSTMGEMASGLAHELNQPLAAIIAYADASQELVDSDRIERTQLMEVLRAVSSQAERAGKIIHRLRSLVKKSQPVRSPIQINDAVREVAALLETETRTIGAHLRLELEEQLPFTSADFVQIQQVLLNLMRNGLDAMADIEPHRRELAVYSRIGDDGHVEIAIRDGGRGVTREQASRLFEPFFTTKAEGLGMGLPISRTIVEAHSGRLWLTPNPDAGMTARFVLPTIETKVQHVPGTDRIYRR